MTNLIFLIGLMGCGKTTIGKLLCENLSTKFNTNFATDFIFVDTDDLIVADYQQDINTIFHEKGEKFFRNLETNILKKVIGFAENINTKYIISTGGGIVLKNKNRELLKQFGYSIYLQTNINTLAERLQNDTQRPLLKNKANLVENLQNLYNIRNNLYIEVADLVINTDNKNIDKVIEKIIENINISKIK